MFDIHVEQSRRNILDLRYRLHNLISNDMKSPGMTGEGYLFLFPHIYNCFSIQVLDSSFGIFSISFVITNPLFFEKDNMASCFFRVFKRIDA